jgi:hypothetical protein
MLESEGSAEAVRTSADDKLLQEAKGSVLEVTGAANEVAIVSKLTSGFSCAAKTPRGTSMKSKGARPFSKMAKTSPKEATALPRWVAIFSVIFIGFSFFRMKIHCMSRFNYFVPTNLAAFEREYTEYYL